MHNQEINHMCKYVSTDFWDTIFNIVNKYIALLDEQTPDKFMDSVWDELTSKYDVLYNDNSGLISLLDDYEKHYKENPNDYDGLTWDEVLDDINGSWDIVTLRNDATFDDHKYSFFYDLFTLLDMSDLADEAEERM